jgi:hypothetical protein
MVVTAVPYVLGAEDFDNYGGWNGMRAEPEARCYVCRAQMMLSYTAGVFACRMHRPERIVDELEGYEAQARP